MFQLRFFAPDRDFSLELSPARFTNNSSYGAEGGGTRRFVACSNA
jgi:hypothetical protein